MNRPSGKAQFTLLGTGPSTGVPVLCCKCSVCSSNNPKNNRTRTSGLYRAESGTTLLIDTGPEMRLQLLRAGSPDIAHILITHAHGDHIGGFDDVRGLYFSQKRAIHCYALPEHRAEIELRYSYLFQTTNYHGVRPEIEFHELKDGATVSINELKIDVVVLSHGGPNVSAFRIGNFAYATDFKAFSGEQINNWAGKIDVMVASGLRQTSHPTHSSIPETIELFRQLRVRSGIITHMSHDVDYDQIAPTLPANVRLGYDGYVTESF